MQKKITLALSPTDSTSDEVILKRVAENEGINPLRISGFTILKKSLDARKKKVWIVLQLMVFIDEEKRQEPIQIFQFQNVSNAKKKVIIIGAGPCGLFAALQLLELGIKPVIFERGKDVKSRRRDLAILNKEGIINGESNYCFGEGGAGTYSDGKLYTRSNKRGDIRSILEAFVFFGADQKILYESHPHIGTNKLPKIISAIRQQITDCGGEVHFNSKLTSIKHESGNIKYVVVGNEKFKADAYILATGHSARDVFQLLNDEQILIEQKPFALGVRVEHPQELIDSIQYHCAVRNEHLPPASYSLVEQVNNRGIFSFCMCPGGIIAPASTSPGELVVNGWSPSKRNNPFANSGMVVQVDQKDAYHYFNRKTSFEDPLLLMNFQMDIEQNCFNAGGGKFVAPAQRINDFVEGKFSDSLPSNSYIPGVKSTMLSDVFPSFITSTLSKGFKAFGKRLKGFNSNDGIMVATESRTSSPVRIPRLPEKLNHPQLTNLFPGGEGAGYAGGIVSAGMDGIRIANAITLQLL